VRYILSPQGRSALCRFAQSKGLVAFDFDGTLAPIADNPADVWLPTQTKGLLKCVSALYPTVVITGRSREDVVGRLEGTGIHCAIGNHGADLGDTRKFRKTVADWKALLTPALETLPGVWIEDKHLSLAIHYRQALRKAETRKAILRMSSGLRDARMVPGKQSVNVIAVGAPHKGMALESRRTALGCETALFVGDDTTDEDVFSLADSDWLVSIRVGRRHGSQARYWLHSQSEIDKLLRCLVELREAPHPSPKLALSSH
jgi:trehalose 6-phosphate phosphatase